jgi:hypothetical protein
MAESESPERPRFDVFLKQSPLNLPDFDYISERQTLVDAPQEVPMMETRHPLRTHVWADGDIPHQITQDGRIIFHHRCIRCGRDFVQAIDRSGWQAASAGVLRIELLADSVTERWVREECPGRLLPDDDVSRATRRS